MGTEPQELSFDAAWTPFAQWSSRLLPNIYVAGDWVSFGVMISVPVVVAFLGFLGVSSWEPWAAAAAGFVALLLLPSPVFRLRGRRSTVEVSEAGLRMERPFRRPERVNWSEVAGIAVREVDPLVGLHTQVELVVGTWSGTRTAFRFPPTDAVALREFLWRLNEGQTRRTVEEARAGLEGGAEIDFGVARLSRTRLLLKHHGRWVTLPLAPWRPVSERPPMQSFELAGGVFWNPDLFARLATPLVPSGHLEIERTSSGGIRRLRVLVTADGEASC